MPDRPTITVDRAREAFARFTRPRTEDLEDERVDTERLREARERVEDPGPAGDD
jgi:hypothetical protein